MLSVGHQLMKARQLRGLSIEDVAFETRIPHLRLRDMENDDLSNFANLTYAKGFLKLYSRYLKLDLSDYLDEFDTSMISAVTGHEYVHTANTVRLLSAPAFAPDDGQRSRIAANLLGIAALTAVLIGGGWFVYKSQLKQTASASPAPTNRPDVAVATAPAETFPMSVETSNTLARADTSALRTTPVREAAPPPKAIIVPTDNVRKATPVDDEGNEIRIARPERM